MYVASMAKESAQKGYLYTPEQTLDHLKPFPDWTSFSRVYRLTLRTRKKQSCLTGSGVFFYANMSPAVIPDHLNLFQLIKK